MPDILDVLSALFEAGETGVGIFTEGKEREREALEKLITREDEARESAFVLKRQLRKDEREARSKAREEKRRARGERRDAERELEENERKAEELRAGADAFLRKYPKELSHFAPTGEPVAGTEALIIKAGEALDRKAADAQFRQPRAVRDPLEQAAIRIAEEEGISVDEARERLTEGEPAFTDADRQQMQATAQQIIAGTLTFETLFDELGLARNFEGGGIAGHPLDIEFFKEVQRLVQGR